MRAKPLLAAAAVAALVVGCGSTVPSQEQATQEQASAGGGGLAVGSSGAPAGADASPRPDDELGTTTTDGAAPSAATPGSTSAAVQTTDNAVAGGPTTGSSAPVRVGLMYSSDANSVASSFGGSFTEPDFQTIQNYVVAYINKTGGIKGHPLLPEYYDASQTKSAQQISQEACTAWVQDDHVLAAVPGLAVIDTSVLSHCLDQAHVVTVYEGSYSTLDAQSFAHLPYWFEPDTLSLNELATVYAQALGKQGFLKGARIGLVYDSYPQFTAVAEKVLIPAIRAAGGNVVSTFQQSIHGTTDIGAGSSAMNSAVLRFHAANVSKVMFFDAWVGGWIEFAIAAQDQSWHPTYGLSSQDGPQDALSTGLVPQGQLPGTVFAGWYAVDDVGPRDGGSWPRWAKCIDVFRRAGLDVTGLSTDGYGAAMSMCSGLLALQDAGQQVSGPFTSAALAQGLLGLGQRLQSATVPATRFAPGRQFGVAGWRPGRYVDSCGCFRYTGAIRAF